ncbi:hypothetical protein ABIB62_002893 [Mucilaginibacter sp. UYP25]
MSHRGGETDFITFLDERAIRLPDYEGNSMFNMLGNFHINPIAGILIIDYSNGETVQFSGKAVFFNYELPLRWLIVLSSDFSNFFNQNLM